MRIKIPFVVILIIFSSLLAAQNNKRIIDSLEQKLRSLKEDTNRVICLNALCFEIKYTDPEKTAKYLDEAIRIAEKYNYAKELGISYKIRGILADERGDYKEAVNAYIKALSYFRKANDAEGSARTEANIGMVYRTLKQEQEALKYFQGAYSYFKGKAPKVEAKIIVNMGICFINRKIEDSSLYYMRKAYELMKQNNFEDPYIYGNLGIAYLINENKKEAEINIKKSIEILESQNMNPGNLAIWYEDLASLYVGTGKTDEALALLKKCDTIFSSNRYMEPALTTYGLLSDVYERKGDYKTALKYHKIFLDIKDTLFNFENNKQINDVKEKYETEKKESEIRLLTADQAVKNEALKKNKIIIYSVSVLFVLILFFSAFVIRSNKQKQKINRELISKNELIETQKGLVEEKQKEILDSISYAKRLQQAILPPEKMITGHFRESFIYYVPKDIVAGDFYWAEEVEYNGCKVLMVAAADCTGHGVPGAMMSMVCSNALHRAVTELKIIEPGKVLNKVRELVIESFEKGESDVKDGMDISLVSIQLENQTRDTSVSKAVTVRWSGANNPLWYFKNGSLQEIKADKQPIGKTEDPKPFNEHSIQLGKGDSIYLFTDGYADQFGGPKGKKFKYKQLQDFIASILHLPASQQKEKLHSAFTAWKGRLEQVDDVCVIGIKI